MSYVYQMTYGRNKAGEEGLFFPSEELIYAEFIRFVIPLKNYTPWSKYPRATYPGLRYPGIIAALKNEEFIFPFLWQNEYTELKAFFEINEAADPLIFPPAISFAIANAAGLVVHFSLDIEITIVGALPIEVINYKGQHKSIVEANHGFINLLPVDVRNMDILYLEHKGLFVGRNPNFLQ